MSHENNFFRISVQSLRCKTITEDSIKYFEQKLPLAETENNINAKKFFTT